MRWIYVRGQCGLSSNYFNHLLYLLLLLLMSIVETTEKLVTQWNIIYVYEYSTTGNAVNHPNNSKNNSTTMTILISNTKLSQKFVVNYKRCLFSEIFSCATLKHGRFCYHESHLVGKTIIHTISWSHLPTAWLTLHNNYWKRQAIYKSEVTKQPVTLQRKRSHKQCSTAVAICEW